LTIAGWGAVGKIASQTCGLSIGKYIHESRVPVSCGGTKDREECCEEVKSDLIKRINALQQANKSLVDENNAFDKMNLSLTKQLSASKMKAKVLTSDVAHAGCITRCEKCGNWLELCKCKTEKKWSENKPNLQKSVARKRRAV
jgi:hypothetical protein